MSIPFTPSVAIGAIEVLTDPQLIGASSETMLTELESRFQHQHPMLISEHLQYAEDLLASAMQIAIQTKQTSLPHVRAIQRLKSGYSGYPDQSIERALAYALERV
jgi:hypothetical protein